MLKEFKKLLLSSTAALGRMPDTTIDAICPEPPAPPEYVRVVDWFYTSIELNLKGERV